MRDFKFFSDNEVNFDEESYDGASWLYGRLENLDQYQYETAFENHYGIHSFLDHFPRGFIVTILSITGPNGRVHNIDTDYDDGWGFDITSDLISIEWVRFRN